MAPAQRQGVRERITAHTHTLYLQQTQTSIPYHFFGQTCSQSPGPFCWQQAAHTHTHTHMHTYTHVHIHTHTHTCTHTHTYTRTYTCTHTHIHRQRKKPHKCKSIIGAPTQPLPLPHPLAYQAVDDKDVQVLVEVVGEPSLLPLYPQIEGLVRVVCVHIRVCSINVGEDVVSYHMLQQTCPPHTNVLQWLAKSLSPTDCLALEGSHHHLLTTPTPLWPAHLMNPAEHGNTVVTLVSIAQPLPNSWFVGHCKVTGRRGRG